MAYVISSSTVLHIAFEDISGVMAYDRVVTADTTLMDMDTGEEIHPRNGGGDDPDSSLAAAHSVANSAISTVLIEGQKPNPSNEYEKEEVPRCHSLGYDPSDHDFESNLYAMWWVDGEDDHSMDSAAAALEELLPNTDDEITPISISSESQHPPMSATTWRFSITDEFLKKIEVDGSSSVSYGWYERQFGNHTSNEPKKCEVVKVEDFLSELNIHKVRKGSNKSAIFDHKPKCLRKSNDCVDTAIYLGELSLDGEPNWVGSLFLYISMDMNAKRIAAALGLMQEDVKKSKRDNSAFRKRLTRLQKQLGSIYNPVAAVINVSGTLFSFHAVNASSGRDPTLPEDENLFIAFRGKVTPHFNKLYAEFKSIFPKTAPVPPVQVPTFTRTVVSMNGDVSLRLFNTVTDMNIPDCPETYQVESSKQHDRGIKRIRETSCGHDMSSSDDEDDDKEDFFPIDPEAELRNHPDKVNAFSHALTITELAAAINELKTNLVATFPHDVKAQRFIEGIIAALFYSNLRWRIGESQEFARTLVNETQSTSFDLDQVSLDVDFKMQQWGFSRFARSNRDFLRENFLKLKQQVFNGELPQAMNWLNFNAFCALKGRGHTLLPSYRKGKFTLISEQSHEGDVMKIALSLTERPMKTSSRQWPVSFDEVEEATLAHYAEKSIKERIFCALVLVAKFLNEECGTCQNQYKIRSLRKLGYKNVTSGENCFECNGGSLLYLLGALQVAALEERLAAVDPTAKSHYVTISIETYGNKARGAVFLSALKGRTVSERAEEIVRGLKLTPTCAASVVQAFSTFCARELFVKDPVANNLYFGVGATCHGVRSDGMGPLWAAFPFSRFRTFISTGDNSQSDQLFQPASDTCLLEDHEANEMEKDLKSICEGFRIPDSGRTNIILKDRFGNRIKMELYPTYGGIPPSGLQPYTGVMYNQNVCQLSSNQLCFVMKWQYYYVGAREALGEAGKLKENSKLTEIAASCLKNLSFTTEMDLSKNLPVKLYRNEHHTEHLNQVREYLQLNCEIMGESGNASRMEITVKSTNLFNHHLSLKQAFEELLNLVDDVVQYYDIADAVATCTNFFASGLRTRSDYAVSQLRESNTSSRQIERMLSFMVEEVGHWQSFYSGRNAFAAKARICKKLAIAASRPILAALEKSLLAGLDGQAIQHWFKLFLDETGVSQANSFEETMAPSTRFERALVIDGDACRHCGTIRTCKHSVEHPCTVAAVTNEDFVCVSSEEFRALLSQWYDSLSQHQQKFVDVVSNDVSKRRRYFLTGFAGCGKTRTLNCLIAKLITKLGVHRVVSVSYTKSAANEVHGSSIHSLFNFGKEDLNGLSVEKAIVLLKSDERKARTIVNLHTLVIDEVSLLTGTGLDLIEQTMRYVRNSRRPFGGAQIVLCGDCLQLPPILEEDKAVRYVGSAPLRQFFFQANAWFTSRFRVCYLHYIFRQNAMTDMLNCIRDGLVKEEHLVVLNESCGKGVSRKLIGFLIDQMAALNVRESTDTTTRKNGKAVHEKLKYKIDRWFINSRCGRYASNGQFIPTESADSVVSAEFDRRGLLNDVDDNEDMLEKMKSKFIIGVENVEMNQFSKAFDEFSKELQKTQSVVIVDAIDSFYDYRSGSSNHISPEQARHAADLIEQGVHPQYYPDINIQQYHTPSKLSTEDWPKQNCRKYWNDSSLAPRFAKLCLYVGQTVIFTSNGVNKLVANNSQGVIEEIVVDDTTKQVTTLVIKPVGKEGLHQPSVKVVRDRCIFGMEGFKGNGDKMNSYHYGLREQFPIKPACWANAYAVQGLTFNDIIIIYNNIRARKEMFGYLYVLISRLQDIMNFIPLRPIVKEDIIAHPDALAFDLYHRMQPFVENGVYYMHKVNYTREFDFDRDNLISKNKKSRLGEDVV